MPASTTNQSSLALMAGLLALWYHSPMFLFHLSPLQIMVSVLIQATCAWWVTMVPWPKDVPATAQSFMSKTLPHQPLLGKYLLQSQLMQLLIMPHPSRNYLATTASALSKAGPLELFLQLKLLPQLSLGDLFRRQKSQVTQAVRQSTYGEL